MARSAIQPSESRYRPGTGDPAHLSSYSVQLATSQLVRALLGNHQGFPRPGSADLRVRLGVASELAAAVRVDAADDSLVLQASGLDIWHDVF